MALLKILKYPDKELRKPSVPVRPETNWQEVNTLIDKMFEAMHFYQGIGLAAPQVGVHLKIITIDIGDGEPLALINPEIIEKSANAVGFTEGCLSLPGVSGSVMRPDTVKIKFLNRLQEEREIELQGLKAICAQHEIDHLEGVLYIDHVSNLQRSMIKKKLKKKGLL